jgi:hypothetical protein
VLTTGAAFGTESAAITPWSTVPRSSWFSTGTLAGGSAVPAVTSTVLRHLVSSGR